MGSTAAGVHRGAGLHPWDAANDAQGIFGMAWALMAAVLIYQNTAAKQWFAAIAAARAQQP